MKNRFLKRLLSVMLAAALSLSVLSFVACGKQLDTPANVAVAQDGTISWDAVENATEYVLKINSEEIKTSETSYKAPSDKDFRVTVTARAEGYEDSAPSKAVIFEASAVILPPEIKAEVLIDGPRTVGGGLTASYKATVSVEGSDDKSVVWSVEEGGSIARINEKGVLETDKVDADKKIVIRATSNANTQSYAEMEVEVLTKTNLTQAMLDELKGDKVSFDGYMEIKLYTMGLTSTLAKTVSYNLQTEMDGTNWHTVYENDLTGGKSDLFYRNIDGITNMVSVSYMNTAEYFPAQDEAGDIISWADGGLYNSLGALTVDDFEFVESAWEWRYKEKGENDPLIDRVVSSANPYDFEPISLGLIISRGAVVGIHSVSVDDYTLEAQHRAVKDLNVLITVGDIVEVPELTTYSRDEEVHPALEEAIENTRNAKSYTVTMRNTEVNLMLGSNKILDGYKETITEDTIYFEPFTFEENKGNSDEPYTYTPSGKPYGYKKISDNLYNSFTTDYEDGDEGITVKYEATRAYNAEFSDARPSFAFAAEIFRSYYPYPTGETMYAVDSAMVGVATTFYKTLGNDIAMFGIFATDKYQNLNVTPRVYVKNGYIIGAEFFYNVGDYMYGSVELDFDYENTSLPNGVNVEFEARQVPTSWNDLVIREEPEDNVGFNAYEYLRDKLFDDLTFDPNKEIPFFGEVLGDSYGFGAYILRSVPLENGSSFYAPSVSFYYDVPLDTNYSIESSLIKIRSLLKENGFKLNARGHWVKEGSDVVIDVEDNELDLYVHVRKKVDGERA